MATLQRSNYYGEHGLTPFLPRADDEEEAIAHAWILHLIPDELCFARLPQLLCLREEKIWSHPFLHGDAEVERLAVRILKTLLRPGYGEKRA